MNIYSIIIFHRLCSRGMDIESTSHFFLHCPLCDDKRITLLSTLSKTACKLIETNVSFLTETLLLGNTLFNLKKTPLSLTYLLIILYLLNDSKNPSLTFLRTATKNSCISNHSFTLSEFFNFLYLYLGLGKSIFFVTSRRC